VVAGLGSNGGSVFQERRKEVVEWLMVHPADGSVEMRLGDLFGGCLQLTVGRFCGV
jgi:hypothetical protein